MSKAEKLLEALRNNPRNVRFSDALRVAEAYFGPARISGSHHVFSGPNGHRVNLQPGKDGKAKGYQIEQLLLAIDTL